MGEYWQATAYRKDLTDILPGCFATGSLRIAESIVGVARAPG
jgi:hypothetical protein